MVPTETEGAAMLLRMATVVFALAGLVACGSGSAAPTGNGSAGPSAPPAGPRTETFMGTTRITASGGCSADPTPHSFQTGEGSVRITLVQSTDNVTMAAQLCDPVAENHEVDCTIPPFVRIDVGMTVTATLKGGRFQTLTIYPGGCGTASTPTPPISYTVTVAHP